MGWLIGFIALLAFALPFNFRFQFGEDGGVKTWVWDGPEFIASIVRRFTKK